MLGRALSPILTGVLAITLSMLLVATDPGIEVEWTAPPGCPVATQVEADVQSLLGSRHGAEGTARVEVSSTPAGLLARIELQTETVSGVRTIAGDDCDALARGVALVIAVWLDPLGVSRTIAESEAERASTQAAVEPDVPPPGLIPDPQDEENTAPDSSSRPEEIEIDVGAAADEGEPVPRARPPISLAVLGRGGVGVATLPGVSAAVGGGVALGMGWGRVELSAVHEPRRRVIHSQASQAGAAVSLTAGTMSACWQGILGRFAFPLCVGGQLGVVTAAGRGLREAVTVRELWGAVSPHAAALFRPLPWLGLGLWAEAPISLRRPRFSIDDFEELLFVVGPAGFRGGLQLEFTFFDEARATRR